MKRVASGQRAGAIMALLWAAALGGCGVHTATHPFDGDMMTISAQGRLFTNLADVRRDALRAAAHETLKRGFAYFEVVNSEDKTLEGRAVAPGQPAGGQTGAMPGATLSTMTSATGGYDSSTYQTPAMALPVSRPGYDLVIRMYHEGAVDPKAAGVWDAKAVLEGRTPAK